MYVYVSSKSTGYSQPPVIIPGAAHLRVAPYFKEFKNRMNAVVFDAIKALLDEGKTPTVALTKSKLTQPIPLPVIIAAVSQYKNNPDSIDNLAKSANVVIEASNDESQLDRIEQKLDRLLALLENKN